MGFLSVTFVTGKMFSINQKTNNNNKKNHKRNVLAAVH